MMALRTTALADCVRALMNVCTGKIICPLTPQLPRPRILIEALKEYAMHVVIICDAAHMGNFIGYGPWKAPTLSQGPNATSAAHNYRILEFGVERFVLGFCLSAVNCNSGTRLSKILYLK